MDPLAILKFILDNVPEVSLDFEGSVSSDGVAKFEVSVNLDEDEEAEIGPFEFELDVADFLD